MTGRIHYAVGGETEGWPQGTNVTVTAREERMVTVCNSAGSERRFPHWDVDVGYESEFDGVWLQESHPRVLDDTETLLRSLRSQHFASSASDRDRAETVRFCEERLHRYGRRS